MYLYNFLNFCKASPLWFLIRAGTMASILGICIEKQCYTQKGVFPDTPVKLASFSSRYHIPGNKKWNIEFYFSMLILIGM